MYTMIVQVCTTATAMGLLSYCPCQNASLHEAAPADYASRGGCRHIDVRAGPGYTGAQEDALAVSTYWASPGSVPIVNCSLQELMNCVFTPEDV